MDSNKNNPPKFLALLATELLNNFGDQLQNLTIVFPNRRAGLFLEKAFQKQITKPIWLPKTLGFDDFLQSHFNKEYFSDLDLRVGLFKCYNKVYKNPKNFPEFLKWSSTILSDFNDIIESLTTPEALLKNLIEIRKIENWTPHEEDKINIQQEFFGFWENLPRLYQEFIKLFENGELFSRSFAEKKYLDELNNGLIKNENIIVFAGFNALSNAEQQIFAKLKSLKIAHFYWDIDEYYFSNPIHEASAPLKKVLKSLKIDNPSFISNNLTQHNKQIEVLGASGNFAQIKLAGNILGKIPKEELHKTAVVLCNPDLSTHFLAAIPQEIDRLNISLGYPIKSHNVFHFFEQIISFWGEVEKQKSANQSPVVPLKKLQGFLDNDFFKKFNSHRELKDISSYFIKNGISFLNESTLLDFDKKVSLRNDLNISLFDWLKNTLNPKSANHNLNQLLKKFNSIIEQNPNELDKLSLEVFNLINEEINSLDKRFEALGLNKNPENFVALFSYLIPQQTIDLIGEPLEGLQIIGLLETRNLDFENLIFISVNEGVLPAPKKLESLIPYDLRKGFGLPTYEHHDGIFAYHFYRAIQRSKKVWLLFNALTDGMGKGEKSRFITQIQSEKKLAKFITVDEITTLPFVSQKVNQVIGKVDSSNQERLLSYLTESGLSPSALNTYLQNPLEFYFRYVEKVKEPTELTEQMEASTMGDIVHKVLQEIYEKFDSEISITENLKTGKGLAEKFISREFKTRFGHLPKTSGKNVLIKEVIKSFVEGVLSFDLKNPKFEIKFLEHPLEKKLTIGDHQIKLKGNSDRIDLTGEIHRVIDYKTGFVDDKELKIETIEELFGENPKPKALQLLFYGYLFFEQQKDKANTRITSGIISTQKISKGLMNLTIGGAEILTEDHFKIFEQELRKCILNLAGTTQFEENLNPKFEPFFA